jgi:hypothetical protein
MAVAARWSGGLIQATAAQRRAADRDRRLMLAEIAI